MGMVDGLLHLLIGDVTEAVRQKVCVKGVGEQEARRKEREDEEEVAGQDLGWRWETAVGVQKEKVGDVCCAVLCCADAV